MPTLAARISVLEEKVSKQAGRISALDARLDAVEAAQVSLEARVTALEAAPGPGPGPAPGPGGPVISSFTAVPAADGIQVSFTLDEPGPAQSFYRPTGTSAWLPGPHEQSSTYAQHQQTIKPLSPGSYEVYIHAYDDEGETDSPPLTAVVASPVPVPGPGPGPTPGPGPGPGPVPSGPYPPSQIGLRFVPWSPLSEPGYRQEVKDPTFAGSITRITPDGQSWRNIYPKIPSFNTIGDLIIFPGSGYGNRLIDGVTYADLGVMSNVGTSTVFFSMKDPELAWAMPSGSSLYRYYPRQNKRELHRTFTGYSGLTTHSEGRADMNDKYLALEHDGGMIVYDLQADTIPWQASLPNASRINYCEVSNNGQYINVRWSDFGSGPGLGNWLYDIECKPIRNLNVGGHAEAVLDVDGQDLVVSVVAGGVRAYRCDDPTGASDRDIIRGAQSRGHICGTAVKRPGYAYLSNHVETSPNDPGWDQIIAVKTDGSQEVNVFSHARTIQRDPDESGPGRYQYDWSTHAVASIDGTRVLWGGGWERYQNDTTNRRSYVVRVAP